MTKILIVDCDGVLLNWRDTFVEWLRAFNMLKEDDESEYNLSKFIQIPGLENQQVNYSEFSWILSELFNQSFMLKKLPPMEGAVKSIRSLHENGFKIKVVSSYTSQYEAMKSREENLINVFGPVFEEIVSLPLHSSKKEWLNKQNKNAFFVEDSIAHIKDALEVGFKPSRTFLIPHQYNYNQHREYMNLFDRCGWNIIKREIIGE